MGRVRLVLGALTVMVFAAGALAACGSNPEANSGTDAYRSSAEPMEMDEWIAGDVNRGEGDRTDWRSVQIETPGDLNVELNADEADTEITIGVFDRHGTALGAKRRSAGQEGPIKLVVKARSEGRYFIKIQQTGGDPSAYSVRATVGDEDDSLSPDF